MEADWRLNGQEKYLFGKRLVKVRFLKFVEIDHAHCSFCWAKFGENEEDLHVGYITVDREDVICEECYNDFKERFQWSLVKELEEG